MSDTRSDHRSKRGDWPTFALRYTFNPGGVGFEENFGPNEVVVFDPTRGQPDNRWIAAEAGSYVSFDEVR